jgi:DNA-directed RNA polymerase specialized sigma24 family protein
MHNTTDKSDNSEADFTSFLKSLRAYRVGCGTINDVVEHDKFQKLLWRFVKGWPCAVFDGERSPEDIAQEISLRCLNGDLKEKLRTLIDIQTEAQFSTWLYVVVRSQFFSDIRRHRAQKRNGSRSSRPIEDYEYLLSDCESAMLKELYEDEGAKYLRQFMEFIKRYPVLRQQAIRLWLESVPLRTIQETLGLKVSHVSISNWADAAIRDFRKSLGWPPLPPREPAKRSSQKASRRRSTGKRKGKRGLDENV